jgi:death-on-curing protein
MSAIVWLARQAVELLHGESLAEHGGLPGLRDQGMLESALARPQNLHAYEDVSDILALAACYGVALAKNHPFNDGNKRIAFVACLTFARLNGWMIDADRAEAAAMLLEVASGSLGQAELAGWLRSNARPRS